ncbi:MAG: hypothetical protein KC592_05190 [Nitrospira sp.]|nr:hypothetical protein [Nitrospira sp.]HBP86214.1 hypothetical protein [Nitrospiraceae bacterium]
MKIQSPYIISFMSLCTGLGLIGLVISSLGIEPEGLGPSTVWKDRDVSSGQTASWTWDAKAHERASVVNVVKKDKGTIITVKRYASGFSGKSQL